MLAWGQVCVGTGMRGERNVCGCRDREVCGHGVVICNMVI